MPYRKKEAFNVKNKLLISIYEAAQLSGIGRDTVKKMAKKDLAERGKNSYVVMIGSNMRIKKERFLHDLNNTDYIEV